MRSDGGGKRGGGVARPPRAIAAPRGRAAPSGARAAEAVLAAPRRVHSSSEHHAASWLPSCSVLLSPHPSSTISPHRIAMKELESGLAAPRVPGLLRRRRGVLFLMLLIPVLVVLALYSAASPASFSSTLRYVHDRVRPAPLDALPALAHSAPPPPEALSQDRYEATEALAKLAKEQGVVLPGVPLPPAGAAGAPAAAPEPDAAAKLALFLRHLEDAAWRVPEEKGARHQVLSPSGADVEKGLREGRGGEAEAKEVSRAAESRGFQLWWLDCSAKRDADVLSRSTCAHRRAGASRTSPASSSSPRRTARECGFYRFSSSRHAESVLFRPADTPRRQRRS